jgi:Asp-tRNA(Asn)/Glu-tRNA(Gln) amidotransferase A subunit family amidase
MPSQKPETKSSGLTRRGMLAGATAAGVTTLMSTELSTQPPTTDPSKKNSRSSHEPSISAENIAQANRIVGVSLVEADHDRLAREMERFAAQRNVTRKIPLPNSVPPALVFDPTMGKPEWQSSQPPRVTVNWVPPAGAKPRSPDDIAFLPLTALAGLIRTRQISSVELTKLYLDRMVRYDPLLRCVVTMMPDFALAQAAKADQEIAAGRYRGPLHGIPWGAKDLIAFPGYPTTWGAEPFRNQHIDVKATVARKMEDAGAVLIAKLTLGALAEGDHWFGGVTRNPWNPAQGSSGSSAGSASAVVAGLVGFALGSETLGSIVSPCRRCGASGLRPTFGRVSRHGCMTLSWSMDKIGPICRSIEDTALVFASLVGADGLDASVIERPFTWPLPTDIRHVRVGYFAEGRSSTAKSTLEILRQIGVQLVPIELPRRIPADALTALLGVEAAAAFDELTRQRTFQGLNNWPNTFLKSRFIPAVDYLQANRLRTLLMEEMNDVMKKVDVYVGGADLVMTNLTGHPTAVLPNGFVATGRGEVPTSITFTGGLFKESELLAVASAYQNTTNFHLRKPPLEKFLDRRVPLSE